LKDQIKGRYQPVSISLASEETLDGYLLGFSPVMSKVHFIAHPGTLDDGSRKIISDEIVYIGFKHAAESQQEHPSPHHHMDELKIITANLDSFVVLATPAPSHAPGFFGYGKDADFPFSRIFFYHHGIRYQEKPELLGDLLIDQEILSQEDVQQALEKQSHSHLPIGSILKEQGLIDDDDIEMALGKQGGEHKKLGDLLIDQKLLTHDELQDALEEQQTKDSQPLGHILLNKGKVSGKDIDSALQIQSRSKVKLGELLIEAHLITNDDLQYALEEQKVRGQRIGEILLSSQVITEDQLLAVLARKFRLPTVDLDSYDINPSALTEISREIIDKYQILPIDTDQQKLTVALADPMSIDAYDSIRFKTGKKVAEVLVKGSQLKEQITQAMEVEHAEEELSYEFLYQDDGQDDNEPISELAITQSAGDAPIVRLVNRLILNGLRKKASDIHILPQAKKITIAYRLNGELLAENALEKSLHKQIAARLKILCGMDIAEQRMPQDGRLMLRDDRNTYEFRVSCIPNSHGESLVLRVLNKEMATDLETLGLRDNDLKTLATMARKPYGLLLVTGPTGSGKSTTLFAVLKSIAHLPSHILTIEDPVESEIRGANQIQVNQKIGLSFARILRNVLRHDPDIIMIGEMRDAETAEIGIEAALTGHLMFSTLHTNSAVDTIIRLNDLGIPNYLIAPALVGVISQNLLKKLCPDCRRKIDKSESTFNVVREMGYDEPEHLYEKVGCEACQNSGYVGRVMLYEFLVVNENVREAIHNGVSGQDMQKIASDNGMTPKSKYALDLAARGIIDHHDFIYSLV